MNTHHHAPKTFFAPSRSSGPADVRSSPNANRSRGESEVVDASQVTLHRTRSILTGRVVRRFHEETALGGVLIKADGRQVRTGADGSFILPLDGLDVILSVTTSLAGYLEQTTVVDWSQILTGGLLTREIRLVARCDRQRISSEQSIDAVKTSDGFSVETSSENIDLHQELEDGLDDDIIVGEEPPIRFITEEYGDLFAQVPTDGRENRLSDTDAEDDVELMPCDGDGVPDLDPDEEMLFGSDSWNAEHLDGLELSLDRASGELRQPDISHSVTVRTSLLERAQDPTESQPREGTVPTRMEPPVLTVEARTAEKSRHTRLLLGKIKSFLASTGL